MTSATQLSLSGINRIALAATIWGSIGILARMVDAHPAVIVFWRVVFAGVTIVGVATIQKRLFAFMELPSRRRLIVAMMGGLLAINWILFIGAIQLVEVSVAVLLAYCGPILVAALTPLVMRERFDNRVVIPLALGALGTIIISSQGLSLSGGQPALGAAMAFASALTYTALIINAKRLLAGIPPTDYALVQYVAASVLLLPAALLLDGPSTSREWLALIVLGVVHTGLTGLLFLSGLRKVRADHAAIVTYAEPLSAVVFAAAFLGETLTASILVGGLAIITGGLMVSRVRSDVTVEGPPLLMSEETGLLREDTDYESRNDGAENRERR